MKTKISLYLATKPKFSVSMLIIFASTFTLLGIYIIVKSFAYSTSDILKPELFSASGKEIERINTNNNAEMAVAMSNKSFPIPQPGLGVIITYQNSWQDTNTAAVLAHSTNSSLLVSDISSLGTLTRNELLRLNPVKVTVVGSTSGFVGAAVNEVKTLLPQATVETISATDSYTLSYYVAKKVLESRPVTTRTRDTFLVDGTNYAYANGTVGVAVSKNIPIVYVNPAAIYNLKSLFANTGITVGYLVPNTAITKESVIKYVPQIFTISSPDRYTLSINAANFGINSLGVKPQTIGVASGIESVSPALLATYVSRGSIGSGLTVISPYDIGSVTSNFIALQKNNINKIVESSRPINISNSTYMRLAGYIGYTFTASQIEAQNILDARIKKCPILVGSTVDFGNAGGYQAVAYYSSGKIVISPTHTASITTILNHEIYHIYDYRQNSKIDYYENIPQPGWDCVP